MNLQKITNSKWYWLIALLVFLFIGYSENVWVGYALAALLFIYACINPKQGLLMLFVYIPIRVFIVEYNSGMRFISDALIFGSLFSVIWQYRRSIPSLFRFQLYEYAFFAFLLIGTVSAFVTGIEPVAIIQQLRTFVLFYLVYYILYRLNITKQDIMNLIWIFSWTALLITIQAVAEKLSVRTVFLPESWEAMPLSAKNRVRIYGMLGNPNVLGLYLTFAFIVFYWAYRKIDSAASMYWNIMSYVMIGLLVLTYSRGSWIGFIIALLAFVLLTRKWKVLFDTVVRLAVSLVLVVLPLNVFTTVIENTNFGTEQVTEIQQFDKDGRSGFADRIGSTFSDDTVTGSQSSGRLFIVKKGFEVFIDYPVLGTGFATFGDSTTLTRSSPLYDEYNINRNFYSDNQYIQIIVQTGILGVLAFAAFLLTMLWILFRQYTRKRLYVFSLTASVLLGGYFMGLVYNLWESDIFTLCFFTLLAIAAKQRETDHPIFSISADSGRPQVNVHD